METYWNIGETEIKQIFLRYKCELSTKSLIGNTYIISFNCGDSPRKSIFWATAFFFPIKCKFRLREAHPHARPEKPWTLARVYDGISV